MKWAIEIQKTSLERRNLSDLLNGLGFTLVEGTEFPALTSPEVDACTTATDAFELAKAVRLAFKQTAQIDPEFALGSVIDYSSNPPRRTAFIEVESCVMTMSVGSPTVSPPIPALRDRKISRHAGKWIFSVRFRWGQAAEAQR